MTPLEDTETHGTPPRRMVDGRLVPVGLDPMRVQREKERRARWGALRALPMHNGRSKATKSRPGGDA